MSDKRGDDELLAAPVTVPEHVVTRSFDEELVVLNLESGEYHGLNPVGAKMFEGLRTTTAPIELVEPLMAEYDQPREVIEGDLVELLRGLSQRGLVVLDEPT
jgi:hypothetical protein